MTQTARPVTGRENTNAERVAASRLVLQHARSRADLRELLDALGLTATDPGRPAPRKRTSAPATTTADAPINTRSAT
ncbi:hypothetical protein AB0A91_16255 [Streptomyces sp. NPDC042207]|uniref:hypothetical protein n=1 Tax=Streptomyces sp. NPDC042207 TaxID=3154331 RepID=UPI0033EC3521